MYFPSASCKLSALEETKMHRQGWLAVGSNGSVHILMKWAWINPQEVLLHLTNYRNLCLTRRVLWVICSCTSNAFEETQNASTGMLDSITPIFLGYWHVLIFWRDARLLAKDRNLILICYVLWVIQLHIKCI